MDMRDKIKESISKSEKIGDCVFLEAKFDEDELNNLFDSVSLSWDYREADKGWDVWGLDPYGSPTWRIEIQPQII